MHVSLCVPVCVIGLTPAGHRVAHTGTGAWVHILDHDEGMLLQRSHGQVAIIGHVLQVAAVPGPDGVANLEDTPSIRAHLNKKCERERPRWYHMRGPTFMSAPFLFTYPATRSFTG